MNSEEFKRAMNEELNKMYDLGVRDATEAGKAALAVAVRDLEERLAQAVFKQRSEYERGFVDGMQKQAASSVDRAVNAMADAAKGRVL